MPPEQLRSILLVEDTLPLARVYEEYLRIEPYEVTHVERGAAALAALEERTPDAVVLDLQLPDMNGLDVLRQLRAAGHGCAVIVVTAHGSVNVAVEAMREGASDFIVKPFTGERLLITLRNALERTTLRRIVETLSPGAEAGGYCGFVGTSLPMQAVYRTIESAAPSKATIFVTGESGTGKEVCAEAIHAKSPRADRELVALNCGAIPHELMESEIFGHVKGAFTGATSDRVGAAARADGGTLFLDEICEMPLDLQVKLLRFVQTGSFLRVGGQQVEKVDVRIVCATNRDPLAEVAAGRFREDLHYRLHVIPIHMPPLRERGEDVLALARHFLDRLAAEEGRTFDGFTPEAEALIDQCPWPGNVRQLQNVMRHVVVLNPGPLVEVEMLEAALGGRPPAMPESSPPPRPRGRTIRPLADLEREAIEAALRHTDNNVAQAAALLEVSPSTIYRKISRWQAGPDATVPL